MEDNDLRCCRCPRVSFFLLTFVGVGVWVWVEHCFSFKKNRLVSTSNNNRIKCLSVKLLVTWYTWLVIFLKIVSIREVFF